MPLFEVYHKEREYAKSLGDPCLGTAEASTKEFAIRIAEDRYITLTGIIVCELHGDNLK